MRARALPHCDTLSHFVAMPRCDIMSHCDKASHRNEANPPPGGVRGRGGAGRPGTATAYRKRARKEIAMNVSKGRGALHPPSASEEVEAT